MGRWVYSVMDAVEQVQVDMDEAQVDTVHTEE